MKNKYYFELLKNTLQNFRFSVSKMPKNLQKQDFQKSLDVKPRFFRFYQICEILSSPNMHKKHGESQTKK